VTTKLTTTSHGLSGRKAKITSVIHGETTRSIRDKQNIIDVL
jgi:hypothetical protein